MRSDTTSYVTASLACAGGAKIAAPMPSISGRAATRLRLIGFPGVSALLRSDDRPDATDIADLPIVLAIDGDAVRRRGLEAVRRLSGLRHDPSEGVYK